MNKHIKVVAGVLAFTLVFSGGLAIGRANISVTAPVTASADTYEALDYKVIDNEVHITACDRSVTDVVIPSEINGLPVTYIEADSFGERTNLKSVTIPDSVQTISYDAFKGCTSLTSVTIPDSVKNIAKGVFEGCTALESVSLGKNTVVIGESAFSGCTSLVSIVLPDSLETVENMAFADCEKLSDVTFPENSVSFGVGAFENTPWLEAKRAENPLVIVNNAIVDGFTCSGDVVIPDGISNISSYAFYGCANIKSVTLPESVKSVGLNAFYDCSSLKVITIMNPNCDIYDHPQTLGNAIVNAPENSTAQAYAEKYNFKFVALGEELPEIPDPIVIKKGDINGDGYIDPVDASIILNYYSYLSTTTDSPVMDIDEFQAAQE